MSRLPHALSAVALIAASLAPPLAVAARSAPAPSAIPDCTGKPVVRPREIVFACGDGNALARDLHWTGWGSTFAAAVGTFSANDCTPNCAAGHFHAYPVVVIARGAQTCPDGRGAYATVTYAFIGRSPYPPSAQSAQNQTVPFACRPRA